MADRNFFRLVAGILGYVLLGAGGANALDWPTRPVTIVVPLAAGGNTDMMARIAAQRLSEKFGQPFIVENRVSAGGAIAASQVAAAHPDGYMMLFSPSSTLLLTPLVQKVNFDADKQLVPITNVGTGTQVIAVRRDLPVKTLAEFIAYAKANPGKLNFAVAGVGSSLHVAAEMFKSAAGFDIPLVFYKGSGPLVADLLGGQVQIMIDAPPVTMNYIKAGRLKALAITGKTRLASLPEVPTFEESGFAAVDATGFQGVLAPAGTPPAAVARLSEALMKALAQPEVMERFAQQGLDAAPSTPAEFAAFIRAEIDKWAKVAKAANIKAD
jgi:tripartite-type tricarboxylate transporter receptor subunit TctC